MTNKISTRPNKAIMSGPVDREECVYMAKLAEQVRYAPTCPDWVSHAVRGADVGWHASQAERYDEMVRSRRGARTLPSRPLAHLAQLSGPQAPPAVSYASC